MTPEDKLNALFAAERPKTPDYLFQAAVAQKMAVRRAWLTVLAMLPWAIAAAAGLWALQPVIEPLRDSALDVAPGGPLGRVFDQPNDSAVGLLGVV